MAEELLKNGVSPLDGILPVPKDPAFGKVEDSFVDLLEKKVGHRDNSIITYLGVMGGGGGRRRA